MPPTTRSRSSGARVAVSNELVADVLALVVERHPAASADARTLCSLLCSSAAVRAALQRARGHCVVQIDVPETAQVQGLAAWLPAHCGLVRELSISTVNKSADAPAQKANLRTLTAALQLCSTQAAAANPPAAPAAAAHASPGRTPRALRTADSRRGAPVTRARAAAAAAAAVAAPREVAPRALALQLTALSTSHAHDRTALCSLLDALHSSRRSITQLQVLNRRGFCCHTANAQLSSRLQQLPRLRALSLDGVLWRRGALPALACLSALTSLRLESAPFDVVPLLPASLQQLTLFTTPSACMAAGRVVLDFSRQHRLASLELVHDDCAAHTLDPELGVVLRLPGGGPGGGCSLTSLVVRGPCYDALGPAQPACEGGNEDAATRAHAGQQQQAAAAAAAQQQGAQPAQQQPQPPQQQQQQEEPLAQLPHLQVLHLEGLHMPPRRLAALLRGVAPSLRHALVTASDLIDAEGQRMMPAATTSEVRALAAAVGGATQLTALHLGNMFQVPDDDGGGGGAPAEGAGDGDRVWWGITLARLRRLESLSLSFPMGTDICLISVLPLTSLVLSEAGYGFDDEAFLMLCNAAPQLRHLHVKHAGLSCSTDVFRAAARLRSLSSLALPCHADLHHHHGNLHLLAPLKGSLTSLILPVEGWADGVPASELQAFKQSMPGLHVRFGGCSADEDGSDDGSGSDDEDEDGGGGISSGSDLGSTDDDGLDDDSDGF